MQQSLTISLGELAQALGMSPQQLKRRHRALHRSGLPLPLTHGSGGSWVWPGLATRIWLAGGVAPAGAPSGALPAAAAPASPPPGAGAAAISSSANDNPEAAARRALRSLYGVSR